MKQKIPTIVGTVIIIIIAVTIGMYVYQYEKDKTWPEISSQANLRSDKIKREVMCTQEAKQCPDGSYVGRTGPNCDFAPCPGEISSSGPKNGNMVGNDRDEHSCIPSAGFTWCEEKQKCLRNWEESCR